jgi:hypothetical protein
MNGDIKAILSKYDAAIVSEPSSYYDMALDITEEWLDLYEQPLPISFWVCREDENKEGIYDLINKMICKEHDSEIVITDKSSNDERIGKISWNWNSDAEKALDNILDILYFRQLIPEISGIKLFGRD